MWHPLSTVPRFGWKNTLQKGTTLSINNRGGDSSSRRVDRGYDLKYRADAFVFFSGQMHPSHADQIWSNLPSATNSFDAAGSSGPLCLAEHIFLFLGNYWIRNNWIWMHFLRIKSIHSCNFLSRIWFVIFDYTWALWKVLNFIWQRQLNHDK